jgi:hypothetical protein
MAAITNATTATSAADSIDSEYIDRVARIAAARPAIWQLACKIEPLQKTTVYTHVIADRLAQAVAFGTETDEVAAVEMTRNDTNTSSAQYVQAVFLSDRAELLSWHGEQARAVELLMYSCDLKMDNLTMALAASMSNAIGSAATTHSALNFNTAVATFRNQVFASEMPPLMVNSVAAMRDLGEDAVTNAAALYGSAFGVQLQQATQGVTTGLVTSFAGIYMCQSSGVAVSDTTGKGNFMIRIGETQNALVAPFLKDYTFEIARKGERLGSYLVMSFDAGVGIIEQTGALRFTTRA